MSQILVKLTEHLFKNKRTKLKVWKEENSMLWGKVDLLLLAQSWFKKQYFPKCFTPLKIQQSSKFTKF